ncbi:hypothetical protein DFH07DRAFT_782254 [Mycena maculata]|uniref:Uncharacterized protein n=1 Tax=Mycena maculata TaxID=230809 RepID=A0AAD7HU20_9AGAR|nr:hypothetical protein DFH07DRAFT_782254 [Mycena maculata]
MPNGQLKHRSTYPVVGEYSWFRGRKPEHSTSRAPLAVQLMLQIGIAMEPFIPGAPQAYQSSFDAGLAANVYPVNAPHIPVNIHHATSGSNAHVDAVPDLTSDTAATFSPHLTPTDIGQLVGSPETTTFAADLHSIPTVNSADDEGPGDTKPPAVDANRDGLHTPMLAGMRRDLKGIDWVALDTPPHISKPLHAYTASATRNLDKLEVLWRSQGAAGANESIKGHHLIS